MAFVASLIAGEQQLVMGREQYIRKMAFGADWNKVRIAMRCCVYGSVNFNGALGLGLTTDSRQYYASNSDMVYIDCNRLSAPQFWQMYRPGSNGSFRSPETSFKSKLNGVVSNGPAGNDDYNVGSPAWCSFGAYPTRFLFYADFSRVSGITGQFWQKYGTNQGPVISDMSSNNFFYDLETPTLGQLQLNTSFAAAGVVPYTGAGMLDSVWLMWATNEPKLIVSDLAVCRWY